MKRVVLVVGHSIINQGASNNSTGVTEYTFNHMLAHKIQLHNVKKDIEIVIEYRDNDYEALPAEINQHDGNLVISLHCNAFDTNTEGCEVLYYTHTKVSDKYAAIMQQYLNEALGNNNRGIKARNHDRGKKIFQRGGYLMKYVKAPCIICEPFFIDNDDELTNAFKNIDKLSLAYLKGIESILSKM